MLYDTIDQLDNPIKQGALKFDFVDGDADFGYDSLINKNDSVNLVLIPFEKTGGDYFPLTGDTTFNREYVIKDNAYFQPSGQNTTIKGEIKVLIDFDYNVYPYDTLRYDFYIIDRAGNKSNTATTTDIGFK